MLKLTITSWTGTIEPPTVVSVPDPAAGGKSDEPQVSSRPTLRLIQGKRDS
jgi:hypothetical protein